MIAVPLCKATQIAGKIVGELAPLCDRIEIAGSIRRHRATVNDIDLVVLPKPGLADDLRARCKARCSLVAEGAQAVIVRLANGLQLDVWIARHPSEDLFAAAPGNFGMLFLSRTGSKEHNIYLAGRAKDMGLHFHPHSGIFRDGQIIAAETEEEVFRALDLDFIPPDHRER